MRGVVPVIAIIVVGVIVFAVVLVGIVAFSGIFEGAWETSKSSIAELFNEVFGLVKEQVGIKTLNIGFITDYKIKKIWFEDSEGNKVGENKGENLERAKADLKIDQEYKMFFEIENIAGERALIESGKFKLGKSEPDIPLILNFGGEKYAFSWMCVRGKAIMGKGCTTPEISLRKHAPDKDSREFLISNIEKCRSEEVNLGSKVVNFDFECNWDENKFGKCSADLVEFVQCIEGKPIISPYIKENILKADILIKAENNGTDLFGIKEENLRLVTGETCSPMGEFQFLKIFRKKRENHDFYYGKNTISVRIDIGIVKEFEGFNPEFLRNRCTFRMAYRRLCPFTHYYKKGKCNPLPKIS